MRRHFIGSHAHKPLLPPVSVVVLNISENLKGNLMSKNVSSYLKEEQIATLKNPPSGGPFHEVNISEK